MTQKAANAIGRLLGGLSLAIGIYASLRHGAETILVGFMGWIGFNWAGRPHNGKEE